MKRLALLILSITLLAAAAQAGNAPSKASPALRAALADIQRLDAPDFVALASWLKGDGRQALKSRGLTDKDIGAARFDTDKWGDAPLGK